MQTTRKMKKIMLFMVLAASASVMMGCAADDPFQEIGSGSNWNNGSDTTGGSDVGGSGGSSATSATTGSLATFDVVIDRESAEGNDSAEEYFPDAEDALENNEFTTEVSIDLSNPVAKTENGVQVTVAAAM